MLEFRRDDRQLLMAVDRKLEKLWKLLKSDQKLPHSPPPPSSTTQQLPDSSTVQTTDNFFADGGNKSGHNFRSFRLLFHFGTLRLRGKI